VRSEPGERPWPPARIVRGGCRDADETRIRILLLVHGLIHLLGFAMCLLAPATLIDPAIVWEAVDDRTARASFANAGHTIAPSCRSTRPAS
jgi:hypothetical protein